MNEKFIIIIILFYCIYDYYQIYINTASTKLTIPKLPPRIASCNDMYPRNEDDDDDHCSADTGNGRRVAVCRPGWVCAGTDTAG